MLSINAITIRTEVIFMSISIADYFRVYKYEVKQTLWPFTCKLFQVKKKIRNYQIFSNKKKREFTMQRAKRHVIFTCQTHHLS